jgi:putative transposase
MERYRITDDAGIYYVTMSVVDWLPVFVSDGACRILADSLNFRHEHKGLTVNAYVFMPTHLHGIVFLWQFDPEALRTTLIDFRKFTGRRLLEYCSQHIPRCFDDVFMAASGADRDRRFWRAGFHPERIETEAFYLQKLNNLHDNPGRKKLVSRGEHWRYSSASYWLSEGKVKNEVILSPLEW